MPVFEYKCTTCEKHIDVLQKVKEEPLITCPYCREDTLIKLFSAPTFTLIGSGYYKQGTF